MRGKRYQERISFVRAPGFEHMYSVGEICKMLGRSPRTVRRWFRYAPGILVILDNREKLHRRSYKTTRVPESVLRLFIELKNLC